MMPNQRFLHQQAQMAHPMLSTLAGQAMPPQLAAGQMFPFFSQCNINPLLLQRNLALNQAPPHQQHFMKKEGVSQSPSSPPRSPASLSAHSTEDGMETPRTQSPDSSHSQTTPTGSKKLSQPMQPSSLSSQNSMNTIFPRRKAGQHARLNSKPVVLNETTLRKLFALPLHEAATTLGISATAMKSACRKLGIKKWPYRTVQSTKTAAARRAFASSGSGSGSACSSPCASVSADSAKSEPASGAGPTGDCLSKDAELLTETMLLFRGRAAMDAGSESEDAKEEVKAPESKNSVAMLLN